MSGLPSPAALRHLSPRGWNSARWAVLAAGLSVAQILTIKLPLLTVITALAAAGCALLAASVPHGPVAPEPTQEADPVEEERLRDPLTQVSTRQAICLVAQPMIEHARRSGQATHCLFIDVVALAQVNETRGEQAGDELLQGVAGALQAAMRGTDVVARWGDDEFVVFGPGTGISPLELERRLRSQLGTNEPADDPMPAGDISVGSATLVPWDEGGLASLVRRAEQDMTLRRSLRRQGKGRGGSMADVARRARDEA